MTGIERLRGFANGCRLIGQKAYSNAIADIADQIERELRKERDRWDSELCEAQMDKSRVTAVYLEMNKHVLGHEGMEDSPVARWARELREALGATMSRHESDGVADSPYDGLTDEEVEDVATVRADAMEAWEWVREHGGLSHVKDIYHDFRAVVERLGIEWSESELHGLMDALDRRLMPEGTQWPCFEDGEPVRPGDRLLDGDGDWFEAVSFMFTCDWWSIRGYQTEEFGDLNDKARRSLEGMAYGTRVKRPDSWERLEEDATKLSPYYYARDVMGLDTDKMPPKESRRIDMMRDLVRRAKALAERDA